MPAVTEAVPHSPVEPVTDLLHGVPVVDPYRWLEDQESSRTREWLAAQTRYARAYLDLIPGRERIRKRIGELLDVETYDSLQKVGDRYFFRKRLPGQEQPCVYFRQGWNGVDRLLIDPAQRGTGPYTSVKPVCVSPDGTLLLYEVKQGGERTGVFELLDIQRGMRKPDRLPRGYLRGFAFAPDSQSFYYVHETPNTLRSNHRAVYRHILGTSSQNDEEIFFAGEDRFLQLYIAPGSEQLGFLVVRSRNDILTDFYVWPLDVENRHRCLLRDAEYSFSPVLLEGGRILASTDRNAPNSRIVQVSFENTPDPEFVDVVPERDSPIQSWMVSGNNIFVSYLREIRPLIEVFDLSGRRVGQLPINKWSTVRMLAACQEQSDLLFEEESFARPIQICSYDARSDTRRVWSKREIPLEASQFTHIQALYSAYDGTQIPIFLVGRKEVLESGSHPTIMTSYGGYGASMTPQFSVFVALLMEQGCLFAIPNIRGGSEFGREWHEAAKGRNRKVAVNDFVRAAEWLVENRRTKSDKLAIFGGSNSGLLVASALTQRPDLFRAVVCIVPMLDMVRYHLFDYAHAWKEEFGTAESADDLTALLGYSPYHNVRDGSAYPATMIVSGDRDQSCNPMHARKMAARLQLANASAHPILLDYSPHRGHSPVLPLSDRIEALTDRLAFLCDQLGLEV